MSEYSNENGKEIINGYEVTSSVEVGNKRIIFAVNAENAEGGRYMQCIMEYDTIFGSYEGFSSDDFFETMKAFADNKRNYLCVRCGYVWKKKATDLCDRADERRTPVLAGMSDRTEKRTA